MVIREGNAIVSGLLRGRPRDPFDAGRVAGGLQEFDQVVARIENRLLFLDLLVLGATFARRVALGAKALAVAIGDHLAHLADDPVNRAAEENAARLSAAIGTPEARRPPVSNPPVDGESGYLLADL